MTDLISRQDAIDAIRKSVPKSETEDSLCYNLEYFPSARPIRQTDALIIADALRYLEQDEERHEMDRATATSLRERILKYGASLSARPTGEWIPCSERLPEEGVPVLITGSVSRCVGSPQMDIAVLRRGITEEEREELERKGDFRAKVYKYGDVFGNNKVPYCWIPFSPDYHNGQDVVAWMPLPTPYKGGDDE